MNSFGDLRYRTMTLAIAWSALGMVAAMPAYADGGYRHRSSAFQHVGTFSVPDNLAAGEPLSMVTSAEIVDVTRDGNTLLYTDSPTERLGFVDIRNPRQPRPSGVLELGGEPTSVAVRGRYALVGVNTSADFVNASGELLVVHIKRRQIVHRFALAGQPDAVAVSPDGQYAAVAIENERDEELNDGLLPQLPAGVLQVLDTRGRPSRWTLSNVDLTGLAETGSSDPEPEFVDINARNVAVVTLQENNHLVVVDLASKQIVKHFSAGTTVLSNVDATEEKIGPQEQGLIELTETLTRRCEPDAVAWVDHDTFAVACEGDYEDENGEEGGSRGFKLFHMHGDLEYDSGSDFEHRVISAGHFPEFRAGNKGVEPEGIEVGKFGGRTLLFVGAERANLVGVYDVSRGQPRFVQMLPTGIGPEGLKAIPERGLLAVSAEVDGMDDGFEIRSLVTLYKLERGRPEYPMLISASNAGVPIPWVAISGLSGDPHDANTVYAVSDSFLAQSYIYEIDVRRKPATIVRRIPVGAADGLLDLEGIAARSEGGFWLASEGRVDARENLVLRVNDAGEIMETITLPEALVANATNSGLEGVAVVGSATTGDETLYVVVQREWNDDPDGLVKIGKYDVAQQSWTFAHYPLDAVESPNGGWVGLSEITALPGGNLAVIERDNQIARDARIKRLYTIDPKSVAFVAYGDPLPQLQKRLKRDLLRRLDRESISVPDKVEGLAVTADRRFFIATDNDGVDENYGETLFFELRGQRYRRSRRPIWSRWWRTLWW